MHFPSKTRCQALFHSFSPHTEPLTGDHTSGQGPGRRVAADAHHLGQGEGLWRRWHPHAAVLAAAAQLGFLRRRPAAEGEGLHHAAAHRQGERSAPEGHGATEGRGGIGDVGQELEGAAAEVRRHLEGGLSESN